MTEFDENWGDFGDGLVDDDAFEFAFDDEDPISHGTPPHNDTENEPRRSSSVPETVSTEPTTIEAVDGDSDSIPTKEAEHSDVDPLTDASIADDANADLDDEEFADLSFENEKDLDGAKDTAAIGLEDTQPTEASAESVSVASSTVEEEEGSDEEKSQEEDSGHSQSGGIRDADDSNNDIVLADGSHDEDNLDLDLSTDLAFPLHVDVSGDTRETESTDLFEADTISDSSLHLDKVNGGSNGIDTGDALHLHSIEGTLGVIEEESIVDTGLPRETTTTTEEISATSSSSHAIGGSVEAEATADDSSTPSEIVATLSSLRDAMESPSSVLISSLTATATVEVDAAETDTRDESESSSGIGNGFEAAIVSSEISTSDTVAHGSAHADASAANSGSGTAATTAVFSIKDYSSVSMDVTISSSVSVSPPKEEEHGGDDDDVDKSESGSQQQVVEIREDTADSSEHVDVFAELFGADGALSASPPAVKSMTVTMATAMDTEDAECELPKDDFVDSVSAPNSGSSPVPMCEHPTAIVTTETSEIVDGRMQEYAVAFSDALLIDDMRGDDEEAEEETEESETEEIQKDIDTRSVAVDLMTVPLEATAVIESETLVDVSDESGTTCARVDSVEALEVVEETATAIDTAYDLQQAEAAEDTDSDTVVAKIVESLITQVLAGVRQSVTDDAASEPRLELKLTASKSTSHDTNTPVPMSAKGITAFGKFDREHTITTSALDDASGVLNVAPAIITPPPIRSVIGDSGISSPLSVDSTASAMTPLALPSLVCFEVDDASRCSSDHPSVVTDSVVAVETETDACVVDTKPEEVDQFGDFDFGDEDEDADAAFAFGDADDAQNDDFFDEPATGSSTAVASDEAIDETTAAVAKGNGNEEEVEEENDFDFDDEEKMGGDTDIGTRLPKVVDAIEEQTAADVSDDDWDFGAEQPTDEAVVFESTQATKKQTADGIDDDIGADVFVAGDDNFDAFGDFEDGGGDETAAVVSAVTDSAEVADDDWNAFDEGADAVDETAAFDDGDTAAIDQTAVVEETTKSSVSQTQSATTIDSLATNVLKDIPFWAQVCVEPLATNRVQLLAKAMAKVCASDAMLLDVIHEVSDETVADSGGIISEEDDDGKCEDGSDAMVPPPLETFAAVPSALPFSWNECAIQRMLFVGTGLPKPKTEDKRKSMKTGRLTASKGKGLSGGTSLIGDFIGKRKRDTTAKSGKDDSTVKPSTKTAAASKKSDDMLSDLFGMIESVSTTAVASEKLRSNEQKTTDTTAAADSKSTVASDSTSWIFSFMEGMGQKKPAAESAPKTSSHSSAAKDSKIPGTVFDSEKSASAEIDSLIDSLTDLEFLTHR